VIAQLIGKDIAELVRTARELQRYPIAGVDLNLGCPAPVVYRKCAGGGLLRDPEQIQSILGALREAIHLRFTVKTRVGFDSPEVFERLLPIYAGSGLDLLTVHGRTVSDHYHAPVRYDLIAEAVRSMPCPVLANGNVHSARSALEILQRTGARGLMIGRGAVRNPWIFDQFRALLRGAAAAIPTGRDVLAYLRHLYHAVRPEGLAERAQVNKMKKYLNFVGLGIEPTGRFLHEIRRVSTESDFFRICEDHLAHDHPMTLEPFALQLKPGDVLAGEHR
jgi:tRNA-dihydrouridine synthase